jgi:hypothetical protein
MTNIEAFDLHIEAINHEIENVFLKYPDVDRPILSYAICFKTMQYCLRNNLNETDIRFFMAEGVNNAVIMENLIKDIGVKK